MLNTNNHKISDEASLCAGINYNKLSEINEKKENKIFCETNISQNKNTLKITEIPKNIMDIINNNIKTEKEEEVFDETEKAKITKETESKLLGNKTNREKSEGKKNEKGGKKKGRKKKFSKEERIHGKTNEDNMIGKIKTYLLKNIIEIINKKIKRGRKLVKIEPHTTKNISKDNNIILLKTKIKDLLLSNPISQKYNIKNPEHNIKVINRIYKDKNENEAIGLIELTYSDYLNIFRFKIDKELENKINKIEKGNFVIEFNKMDCFIRRIIEQEKKKNESWNFIKNYVINFSILCFKF